MDNEYTTEGKQAYWTEAGRYKTKREKHPQCVLCKLVTHASCSCFSRNTLGRFAKAFASICIICKEDLQES